MDLESRNSEFYYKRKEHKSRIVQDHHFVKALERDVHIDLAENALRIHERIESPGLRLKVIDETVAD